MRRLSAEEAALWRAVAGSVKPIRAAEAVEASAPPARRPVPFRQPSAVPAKRLQAPPGQRNQANTLDGSWDKAIATGRIEPEFTIDLHGETLASAHARLNRSLDFAIRQGVRTILLITGKPQRDNPRLPPTSRGVIRASVQDWLAASTHAGQIAAIRGAHPRHGGSGALYLILRRQR